MGKKEDLLISHPSPPPPINNERSLKANWILHDHSVEVKSIKTKLQKTNSINQGFWQVAAKKVKFRGIIRDKFVEKSGDFVGVLGQFSGQTSQGQGFWRFSDRGHH